MSSVQVCLHLWHVNGLVVNTVLAGQHRRIPLCVFVCVLLELGFRLQLLSVGTQSALNALIIADEDLANYIK